MVMDELNIYFEELNTKTFSDGIKMDCINLLAMEKSTLTQIKGIIHEVSI